MNGVRAGQTATLLPDGTILVAGGRRITSGGDRFGSLTSVERYDPGSGSWAATGNMIESRGQHTATLLPDGTVLVAGGFIGSTDSSTNGLTTASAELYEPSTGSWRATGEMIEARQDHVAVLLPNGTVLVAGGSDSGSDGASLTAVASAELYDPNSGSWTAISGMIEVRWSGLTATLLLDGEVLVAGGFVSSTGSALPSAELYDPASKTWTATGNMIEAHVGHTATLMPDGKVLVAAGGVSSDGLTTASAELYDPRSGSWTATGSLDGLRAGHTATLLLDGEVLVAGGRSGDLMASAELYDPGSGSWTLTGGMIEARYDHTATLLPDGTVLVAGGSDVVGFGVASAERYHPGSGS